MIYQLGATSVSVDVQIVDDSGLPVTGLVAATFPTLTYSLAGANADVAFPALSDLATITTAYSSGGVKERGNGYYRLDVPNGAFTTGGVVTIRGEATGKHVLAERLHIVAYSPQDATRLGLSALPNAAANANGGLPILSSAGTTLAYTISTLTTYTGNTPQTGDAYAVVNNGTYGNSALHTQIGSPWQVGTKYAVTLASTDVTGNLPADAKAINAVSTSSVTTVNANIGFAGAPGAANGGLIAGSNVATTIAGLTLAGVAASGSTPATSGLTVTGGAASTTSGGTSAPAISATGGAGAASTNGAGAGVVFTAGGTTTVSGNDGFQTVGTGNNHGQKCSGAGSGHGIAANGGSTGNGIAATGGTSSGSGLRCTAGAGSGGDGIKASGDGIGNGANLISGAGATGDGLRAASLATNGNGINTVSTGTGKDLNAKTTNALQVDINTIKTQTVTCSVGVTINANLGFAGAPGAANGGLIAGSNTATTIAGLTLSGAAASGGTPATSGLIITGGAASTTAGGTSAPAISATGGAGAATTNGAAAGVTFTAGGTTTVSGNDGFIITATGNGNGIHAIGGASAIGPGGGNGALLEGGAGATAQDGGNGLYTKGGAAGTGAAGGIGFYILGGDANGNTFGGDGLGIVGGPNGQADAIFAAGSGAGTGFVAKAGPTGTGMIVLGGSTSGIGLQVTTTSGDGVSITPTAGNGVTITANGTSKHGVVITGGTAGTSDGLKCVAGTGGVDIRGNITGNVTGNVSGSVASVTAAVTVGTLNAGVITAASIAASALNDKGNWLVSSNARPAKNTTLGNFEFPMYLSSDHVSPATGKTVSAFRSIDGAAFAACNTTTATEISNGVYSLNLAASDMNGTVITLRFTATGCDDTFVTIITEGP